MAPDAPTPDPSPATPASSAGGTAIHRLDRSRATDDWYTPPSVLDRLPKFDLDPCVPLVGPSPWQRVDSTFDATTDGLSRDWWGHVWVNPPYSNPGPWIERLAEHGDGIALIFARTETGWWSDHVWSKADLLLFIRRRVSFVEPTATADRKGHNAPAPSVLVAYGAWAVQALRQSQIPGHFARPEADDGA